MKANELIAALKSHPDYVVIGQGYETIQQGRNAQTLYVAMDDEQKRLIIRLVEEVEEAFGGVGNDAKPATDDNRKLVQNIQIIPDRMKIWKGKAHRASDEKKEQFSNHK